jgi:hypothetical protein
MVRTIAEEGRMPNPLEATQAFLAADVVNLPASTTRSTSFPTNNISVPHIQFAWDGTPSDADNREDTTIRITVWTPKGQVIAAQDIAEGLRARFLDYSSADVSRVNRGAGRLPGVDDTNKLPFCTFTVSPVMRALAS